MNSKQKKNSVRFVLAPRAQRDPLAADFDAPQHVLLPKGGLNIDQVKERLPDFDPTLFPSKDETRVGMLERAHNADGLTFDSDILQAMSKDFDFENPSNVLDDDFIDQAGGLIEEEGEMLDGDMDDLTLKLFQDEPEIIPFDDAEKEDCSDSDDSDDYDLDRVVAEEQNDGQPSSSQGKKLLIFVKKAKERSAGMRAIEDDEEERKSIFTNYSMTSSVMRRNQGLQQIDEHFERLYEKEYADEADIGPANSDNEEGEDLLSNFEQIRRMKKEVKIARKRNHGDDYEPEVPSEHYLNAVIGDDWNEEEDRKKFTAGLDKKEGRLDCESILSLNSNLYNHPKLIVERRIRRNINDSRMDIDGTEDRSRSSITQSIASTRATILSKLSSRPANETSEDRRARKKALKAYRHERRKERKQNQQIFKREEANLAKQTSRTQVINFS